MCRREGRLTLHFALSLSRTDAGTAVGADISNRCPQNEHGNLRLVSFLWKVPEGHGEDTTLIRFTLLPAGQHAVVRPPGARQTTASCLLGRMPGCRVMAHAACWRV